MYKEYTRPLEQQIDTDKNIFSVLDERANRTPNDSLVEYKNEHGEWSSFSATEFRAKVIAIAKGHQEVAGVHDFVVGVLAGFRPDDDAGIGNAPLERPRMQNGITHVFLLWSHW